MTVTIATLRAAHREFADTANPTDAEVQDAIDRASRLLDSTVLGSCADDAIDLMACQTLALTPYAQDLRLGSDKSMTIYDKPLERILEIYGRATRVLS